MTPHTPARLPTGDLGLDRLTEGGLLRSGLQVIVGVAGAGKTILAHQIGALHVREGGSVVYLTALIESHAMLLAQARTMRFFDPAVVPKSFYYASLYPALQNGGLDAMTSEIRRLMGERAPSLIIIDGLHAFKLGASSELDYQRFVHDLETQASVGGASVIILAHPRGPNLDEMMLTAEDPTYTVADGVLALRTESVTLRRLRWLSVLKLRGVDHVPGWHSFEITRDGIRTYPRLEALVSRGGVPLAVPEAARRDASVRGLAKMLGGGFSASSITLLIGTPGSGKTLLGLAFLAEGVSSKQGGAFFGFHETPDRLIAKGERVGLPLRKAVDTGKVHMFWRPPSELLSDEVAEQILAAVRAGQAQRLVIDSLDDLRRGTVVGGRDLDFLSAFFDILRAEGATVLISQDLTRIAGEPLDLPMAEVSPIVDNLIYLRQAEVQGKLKGLIAVLKMRESEHDRTIRELVIGGDGLRVGDALEQFESLLVGLGRAVGRGAR